MSKKINVGTVGHIDHGKLAMVASMLNATGSPDAVTDEGLIDIKTTGKPGKGKSILIQCGLLVSHEPDLPECYAKLHTPFNEQSWNAMNKGGFSKKQRRGKL